MSASTDHNGFDALKRAVDVVVAGIALVATAPLQVAVAAAVAYKLGRPVIFRQSRPGRYAVPFTIVKFRTMREVNGRAELDTDANRLVPLGIFLRKSSLDELPTLWNVLRGDMSLVGPRPLLMEYLSLFSPEQGRRHEVRPGMTGLAQVRGRNNLSWDEKLISDVEYVDRRGPRLDLQIVLQTVSLVLRRRGISAPGEATAPPFLGSAAAGLAGGR